MIECLQGACVACLAWRERKNKKQLPLNTHDEPLDLRHVRSASHILSVEVHESHSWYTAHIKLELHPIKNQVHVESRDHVSGEFDQLIDLRRAYRTLSDDHIACHQSSDRFVILSHLFLVRFLFQGIITNAVKSHIQTVCIFCFFHLNVHLQRTCGRRY